jgi:hypothetical protein
MWGMLKTTNRETVSTVVVILGIKSSRIEVQVVGVICIVTRRRPIVPVGTLIVNTSRRVVTVTSER